MGLYWVLSAARGETREGDVGWVGWVLLMGSKMTSYQSILTNITIQKFLNYFSEVSQLQMKCWSRLWQVRPSNVKQHQMVAAPVQRWQPLTYIFISTLHTQHSTLTCFSPDPLSLTLSLMLDYDAHDSVQTSQTKYLKFKIAWLVDRLNFITL